jgi:acyl-CoA thioesterase I
MSIRHDTMKEEGTALGAERTARGSGTGERSFGPSRLRVRHTTPLFAAGFLLVLAGCDGGEPRANPPQGPGGGAAVAEAPAAPAADRERVVLFVGTSLTAGYGLPEEQAYPAHIQAKIDSAGLPFHVINAGVSGETSAGARRRLDWLLRQPFDVLVLETGANDMLRGQDPDSTRANIQAIVDRVRETRPDAEIVLAGMLALPNLGREFGARFERIFPEIAREEDLTLIPFLLNEVAAQPALNLPDGVHPNEDGQRRVAQTVWSDLEPVLRRAAQRPPT